MVLPDLNEHPGRAPMLGLPAQFARPRVRGRGCAAHDFWVAETNAPSRDCPGANQLHRRLRTTRAQNLPSVFPSVVGAHLHWLGTRFEALRTALGVGRSNRSRHGVWPRPCPLPWPARGSFLELPRRRSSRGRCSWPDVLIAPQRAPFFSPQILLEGPLHLSQRFGHVQAWRLQGTALAIIQNPAHRRAIIQHHVRDFHAGFDQGGGRLLWGCFGLPLLVQHLSLDRTQTPYFTAELHLR